MTGWNQPDVDLPDPSLRPRHVAIIMDGNGRWAVENGLDRIEGHRRGASVVRDITTFAREAGIEHLTLYSFSRQNWCRSASEVAGLMGLLEDYCLRESDTLMDNGIRLVTIGAVGRLPDSTRSALLGLCRLTENNRAMTLCLAVDYGGREELVSAVQRIVQAAQDKQLAAQDIDEAVVQAHLLTAGMPDPDLLIRTSGEQRISNFLLWQLAYAEMHFTTARWPEFRRGHFATALQDFARRHRRFGGCGTSRRVEGA
jgi:undecaprenyl diphosphate synthase